MTVFFDVDFTLLDTDAYFEGVQADLYRLDATPQRVEETLEELNASGYSFEAHLRLLGFPDALVHSKTAEYEARMHDLDAFLLPGVVETVAAVAMRVPCHLLTFGFPPYQGRKVRGLRSLVSHVQESHFVWKDQSKGDFLQARGEQGGDIFVDDSPAHLLDVSQKAPWVRCVRAAWPKFLPKDHPGDGVLWASIVNADELTRTILSAL